MRIALLVVTLASVAGPAIAPEAYLSPQSQPQPQPRPDPSPPDTEPTPEPTKKHIALGLNEYLFDFWYTLNTILNPLGIYVYQSQEWFEAGLTEVPYPQGNLFNLAFVEASEKAEHIHFNLQGLPEPRRYAEKYGGGGVWGAQIYVTAWELWMIQHNPTLCAKTTFYEDGITPSPSAHTNICGP